MREPYRETTEHRKDTTKNIGYDYRGNVLKRTLSPVMYAEPKRAAILDELDALLVFLIDAIKHIKKQVNFTLPKHYRDFN